ncbi:hypothetical protein BGC07_05515 [Piscirickettsia litoralis]|uniref:Uncharacterized protein n=1 Tax=Piscirickettsia litoralis TaxID=1891921 RepID=A0ABX3A209_9GAMM|nr:hypothetical protein BGC07_05515 [Piscirickettsia litoralis]
MLVLLYLINPRKAIPVFVDCVISYEPVENIIRKNSEKLGIDIKLKTNSSDLVRSKVNEVKALEVEEGSVDYGG